ncbi:MAG: HNH endonuclease [Ktedonobacterales bacterium]
MQPGDVLSYVEMCQEEGESLQRGMNYRLRGGVSVILMSVRPGAPYADRLEEDGAVLIYEGHDVPKSAENADPKSIDQPMRTVNGHLTQNGLFFYAASDFKLGKRVPEVVKVYEKIRAGMWTYNGLFQLTDAWNETVGDRKVFRFRLELIDEGSESPAPSARVLEHNRMIPTSVKLEVWRRDEGRCVLCGSAENLHFDHIIPFSKGGSSLVSTNIQLLCAQHNLRKHDRIE